MTLSSVWLIVLLVGVFALLLRPLLLAFAPLARRGAERPAAQASRAWDGAARGACAAEKASTPAHRPRITCTGPIVARVVLLFACLFFGSGSRIGEAAVPGPVALHLELLLHDGSMGWPGQSPEGIDEPMLIAACARWRDAIVRRRHAYRLAPGNPERTAHIVVREAEEAAAYARARRTVVSYAQRVRRRPLDREDAGEDRMAPSEDGDEESADDGELQCKRELKEALAKVERAVRTAFAGGRRPDQTDADSITCALQAAADAVLAGRMSLGVRVQCTHPLSAFYSPTDGYTCDVCRNWCSAGSRLHGCRECNVDVCQACFESGRQRQLRQPQAQDFPVRAAAIAEVSKSAEWARAYREALSADVSSRRPTRRHRRRRGSGATRRKKFLNVFYGNVTSMSHKAEHYLLSLPDCLWFAAETHVRKEGLAQRCRDWAARWEITAAPATPSTESISGSYGGVVAAARRHLATSIIAGDVSHDGWVRSSSKDLAGRTAHLQGVDVLVFGGYARHGDHAELAVALATASRNGSLPFICLADFNTPPTRLEEAEWLLQLDAVVVRPNAVITCHQGQGTLIDYCVMSRCLLPYVEKLEVVTEVPWKPHDGLRLVLKRCPRTVMVRTFVRPRPLKHVAAISGCGEPLELAWHDALSLVQSNAQSRGHQSEAARMQCRAAVAMGIGDEAESLGIELATWAQATELQALARAGLHPGIACRPFLGRCGTPRFRTQPMARCPRLSAESLRLPGGYGIAARLWATCRALAAKLLTALKRNAAAAEVCLMKERVLKLALRESGDLRAAWEAMTDSIDGAAGLFAILAVCAPAAPESSVEAAVATFERLEQAEAQRGREIATAAWNRWVGQAISGGARLAHRWANLPNAVVADVTAPDAKGPLEVAKHHTAAWALQWKAGNACKVEEAFEAVKSLRHRAMSHPMHCAGLDKVTPTALHEAARMFRRGTSIGADAVALEDILGASDESLEELCRIMHSTVRKLAMPRQTFMVLISLLGKKLGGSRGIAVCTTFYRLLLAVLKGEVREWDVDIGLEGDSALPGRSPLEETAWRHLMMEQASLRGKFVGQLLWDLAKFFDSLNIPLLIKRAEELHFPIDQLVLGMQAHRAPRVLRVNGCCAEPIAATGASILAGCTLSTSLSRAFVRDPVSACGTVLEPNSAKCNTYQHVDDVSQVVVADSEQAVVAGCVRAGLRIATAFVRSGLAISVKSVAVASSTRLAERIAMALGRAGQQIDATAVAEDLGVPTGCGSRRAVGAFKKRLARGLRRARRVRALVRADPRATKLYSTGVKPQQSYGSCVHGAAPSQVQSMRRAAVLCCAPAGVQACTTTLLAWRLGSQRDPAVATPLEQVKLWMKLWARASPTDRRDLRKAWARALPRVLLRGVRWSRVAGPLQATMAVLGQCGWHPIEPDRWISPDGSEYAGLQWAPHANVAILVALEAVFIAAAWRSAQRHFLGKGLEAGTPDLGPARSARQWLRKHERWKEVKALDQVVCGGIWDEFRMGKIATCARCGKSGVGAYHRYWSCPKLLEHTDEHVRKTQWMTALFGREHAGLECLWGRGILPACVGVGSAALQAEDIVPACTPAFHEIAARRAAMYTDGSGGPRWVPHSAKRVGSAAGTVQVSTERGQLRVSDVGILIAPAPGKPTVPRSEVWAAILAAQVAPVGSCLELGIDAAYVVKGMSPGREVSLSAGTNGDLWSMFFGIVRDRSLSVSPRKVKAHGESQVLRGSMGLQDFLGNVLADAGAGVAAEDAVHPLQAQDASEWQVRAFLVARRLAIIEADLWCDEPRLVPAPEPIDRWEPPPLPCTMSVLQRSVDAMGHKLHQKGGFLQCSRCRKRRKLSGHKFWTSTRCTGINLQRQPQAEHSMASGSASQKRAHSCHDAPSVCPNELCDEDPFGYAQLGLDDAATDLPSPSSVPMDAAQSAASKVHIGEGTPAGPTRAEQRLKALRLRVRARERGCVIEVQGSLPSASATEHTADRGNCSLSRRPREGAHAGRSVELVTPAKRRRIVAAQRAAQREDAAAARLAEDAAWRRLATSLPWQPMPEGLSRTPFRVDSSHECITCGGFVGCLRCGSVVSAHARSALAAECRGHCPTGALGPVRRLALGRIPRGDAWPSGELAPLPKRLRV